VDVDRIIVSSSLVLIAERLGQLEIDQNALATFLRLGFFLGDDTPFKSIRSFPPGAWLAWSASGCQLKSGTIAPARATLSRDHVRDAYIELFRDSIRQCDASGITALPLSGGRDSRHILGELHVQGRLPQVCLTVSRYGDPSDQDISVAKRLAVEVGSAHVTLPSDGGFDAAEEEKNRVTGFCADEHGWLMPASRYLKQTSVSTIFDGIGGDVLSAGLFLEPLFAKLYADGRLRQLALELLSRGGGEAALAEASVEVYATDRAIERLTSELGRFVDYPNPLTAFYFWNRTRREIALSPYRVLGLGRQVFCPYLYEPLVDVLLALPPDMTIGKTLHDEVIAKAYPQFAGIPYAAPPPRRATWQARREALSVLVAVRRDTFWRKSHLIPRLGIAVARGKCSLNLGRILYAVHLQRFLAEPLVP
jgi:asparagine synthase (glutamine-hydrolysing)